MPAASARGQTQAARRSLAAWRAAAGEITCSWARLEGDAHRSISPLLQRLDARVDRPAAPVVVPLAAQVRVPALEAFDDVEGTRVDTRVPVAGGVRPLELQAECGFHAYAEVRLRGIRLEEPAPGLDPRDRGMLMHKALELVWIKLKVYWHLQPSTEQLRKPLIHASVEAAKAAVFRGFVPHELRPAVEREQHRLERLIETLLTEELKRPPFAVVALETRREGPVVHVRPELVVEIAFDGVQTSPRYPAGLALRFARVKRYRPDKTAADADTVDSVRALHS